MSIVRLEGSRWNRYRVWQPLSLMAIAGLTPPEWNVTLIDENVRIPRDGEMPHILSRVWKNVWHRRQPLINLFGSLSYRRNLGLNRAAYANFSRECAARQAAREPWDGRLTGSSSQGRQRAGVNRAPASPATETPA